MANFQPWGRCFLASGYIKKSAASLYLAGHLTVPSGHSLLLGQLPLVLGLSNPCLPFAGPPDNGDVTPSGQPFNRSFSSSNAALGKGAMYTLDLKDWTWRMIAARPQ